MKKELPYRSPLQCLAAWNSNTEKRRRSASGGIAHALAEHIIAERGVVFGTRYDADLTPVVAKATSVAELEAFKGSKYVQSSMGAELLSDIKQELSTGKQVLFIGTPCQVAAVYSTLDGDCENLLTVDLMCHGTCPTSYFTDEIDYLRKYYQLEFDDVRFRDNEGNAFHLTLWNKGVKVKDIPGYCEYYFAGFLYGITMREICYSCKFARPERIADITLGDFIGLGSKTPFAHKTENVSAVLLNSHKSQVAWRKLMVFNREIVFEERDYEERLSYPYSLLKPFPKDPRRQKFLALLPRYGFVKAIRRTLWPKVWRSRFWQFLRDHHINII